MIRQCTEQGKKLLYQYRYDISSGIFSVKTRSSAGKYICIFLTGIIMFIIINHFTSDIIPPRYMSSFIRVFAIIAFGFFGLIVSEIYEVYLQSKDKKKFLKSDLIYFNGATIVEVDHDNKRLLYVEDDLLEQDGTPLLLAYPLDVTEIKRFVPSERVMILYDMDGNYHMMKVDERIKQLSEIGNNESVMIDDLKNKEPIPHWNALKIDKDERALSYSEKKQISLNFARAEAKSNMIFAALIGAFFIGATIYWAFIYGRKEGGLQKAIIVGMIICLVICFSVCISYWIMQFYFRKKYEFTHVKETIINSIESISLSSHMAIVYEWEINSLAIKRYENLKYIFPVEYGGVCYRLRTSKGEFIFYPKDEIIR